MRKVETTVTENIKSKSLSFYHAGRPYLFIEWNDEQAVMNKYPDVAFYQIQMRGDRDIIRICRNSAFDLDYVKTRGEQASVIMDSMKTLMNSEHLSCMNKGLRKNNFALVKELMHLILPLYRNLYQDNQTGPFAVPAILENDDKQYSFGISAIIKWDDGELQYLNTLIMDEMGFVEENEPGLPWFLVEGVTEQKDMPEELKTLFIQINEDQQGDISQQKECIHY